MNIRLPKRHLRNVADPFELYLEDEFRRRYRFTKEIVRDVLFPHVKHLEKQENRGLRVPTMTKLLLTLRFYATGCFQQMCGDLCGISQPTACGAIHTITEVFAGRLRDHIRLPSTHQEAIDAMTWFFDYGGFPGVVAAVDGTHILIANPGGNSSEVYRNVFSINVQVAAGINLKIVDIVARRPGSFNDATIFEGSGLHMAFEEGRIEGHLLGDSEYPCLPFLFTPLPPQNARTEPEIRYNLHHEKSLNAAKHLFGLWKRRFRCLKSGLEYKPYFVVAIICATAVLYNISREVNEPMPDDEFPWVEEVHQPLSPSPDHANRVDHHFREDFIRCHFT